MRFFLLGALYVLFIVAVALTLFILSLFALEALGVRHSLSPIFASLFSLTVSSGGLLVVIERNP